MLDLTRWPYLRRFQARLGLSDRDMEEFLKELGEVLPLTSPKNRKVDQKSPNLENIISNLLLELGMSASLSGYAYSREAIRYAILNYDKIGKIKITQDLYPSIARKFDTTSARVERGIRTAIETSTTEGTNPDKWEEVFGYSISLDKGKPANSQFVYGLADYIKRYYNI